MTEMKRHISVATLIGDVVGSRTSTDRARLHGTLSDVLARANEVLDPVVALRVTVGDEFQGCFATVGAAVHASLWLRLHLVPEADLRHGIGWGEVAVLAEEPRVEDGPGWWAARDAIDEVKAEAARPATRLLRTAYHRAPAGAGAPGPDPRPVNAALMCRDHVVGSVAGKSGGRALRLLRGTIDGVSQAVLAEQEGISASAVSQRIRHDGLAVVLAADELLRGV